MSKKKSSGGNTMTLKDFHGGSIPSDLPLPSAPGVIVRPADRDRQTAWGNSTGRSDHRLRPNSSGSMRNLDDKTPFITNSAHIGRNFDEDERKPLDGGSLGPRRTVSDESIRAPVVRSEPKGLGPVVPQVVPVNASSYSSRVVDRGHSGVGSRPLSGGGGSYPNAWGVRKEAAMVAETISSPWTGTGLSTVSKFAQASALDQITSGRWQTKSIHHQADIEVIRQCESPNGLYGGAEDRYTGVNIADERGHYDNTLARHVERGLVIEEGIQGGIQEMSGAERVHSPVLLDGNERSSVLYTNDGQPAYPDSKYGGSESQLPSEVSGRPKLKLLPRSKPLDTSEASAVDYKQGFQQPLDISDSGTGGIHGNASHFKPGLVSNEASHVKPASSSSEAGNRLVERPKLNLKPRSQPLDKSEGSTKTERIALFGGARPREMVLKERGVDDDVNGHGEVHAISRINNDVVRPEITPVPANISRHSEKTDSAPGRGSDRREQRPDVWKGDMQRKNWRNDSWRNTRDDPEKQHQQERQPSPETWRKPVEQPKPDSTSGLRFGKAVSAVELAQAFSRPVSEPTSVDQFSGQRALPARTQIPFSRLTGPATRPQINGY